jgi:hypothetical protein
MMTDAPPFPPMLVHSRGSVADALQARRKQLGLTMEALDHRAGLQSGYSGKLFRPLAPQGRAGVHWRAVCDRLPSGDIVVSGASEFLTEALGLRLVLVDAATADAIGAVPAPRHVGGKSALHHSAKRDTGARRMTAGQYESLHGAKVSHDLLKTSCVEHPYIQERADLRDEAEAILALLNDLYGKIASAAD